MLPGIVYTSVAALAALILTTSCSVNEEAGLFASGSPFGGSTKAKTTEVKTDSSKLSGSDKAKADREAKSAEESKAAAAEARKLALKNKELEAEKRKFALKEKAEAVQKENEEADKIARAAAEKSEKAKEAAAKLKERETAKFAKAEARRKAEEARAARELEELGSSGGGFFSRLAIGTPSKYKSEGHDVFVNQRVLQTLEPANAKVEISLSEQRARIYKQEGAEKVLVIETQVSTGKSGHSTSPGTFKISEKLPSKQSTLYGHWVNADGVTVASNGSADSRPAGGVQFVGAEMPYWMRINGGIGMHIGHVPDHPASHGCIRVPSTIQPLIFAKVGLGTEVTIIQ